MLFTEKYAPFTWNGFIGNSEVLEKARAWADAWQTGKKQKPLIVYGAPGVGKTALALLIAKEMDWQLFELNASDFRTKDVIEKFAGTASQSSSFFGKKRLILLDEIDGLQSADRGGASAVVSVLKDSMNPIILTANDIYANPQFAGIRAQCELLQFKKINYLSIAKHLREICEKELISFEEDAVKALAKDSEGDLRACLLDLQNISFSGEITLSRVKEIGFRQRRENVFNTVAKIFKAKTLQEVRGARAKSECDDDLLMQWIHENIPRVFKGEDIAIAMDFFSRGDVFEGRIFRRQNYGFRRYSYDLMSSGSVLSNAKEQHGWIQFMFPQLLKSLSASRATRAVKISLCKKVGKKVHSSALQVMQQELPLLQQLFSDKEKAISLSFEFGFDENEIAFLLETKPETKKVQTIFEEAQKLKEKSIKEKRFLYEGKEGKFARFEKETKPENEKINQKKRVKPLKERSSKKDNSKENLSKERSEKQVEEKETDVHKQTKLF